MANHVERISMRPAPRQCLWSFAKRTEDQRTKECVVNSWCRCTARGPQHGTGRNAALTCCASVDFECLVEIRACSDTKNAASSRWYTVDDFVSTADIEDLRWLENMPNEKFENMRVTIGHEEESKKQIKVPNRFISVKEGLQLDHGQVVRRDREMLRQQETGRSG